MIRSLLMFRITLLLFLFSLTFFDRARAQDAPLFSFGLIADIQYADVESSGKRDYRGSLARARKAVSMLNDHELAFTVHCGDLIDRDYASFDAPLAILRNLRAPVHFVVGNHEFSVADSLKRLVRKRLNNPRGYRSFVFQSYQFILVDAMDVSVHSAVPGTRAHREALQWQEELKKRKANNAYDWNGALGKKQLKWLEGELRAGQRKGYRTILFSHHPLLPENGLQMWNSAEVIAVLKRYPSVIAFISGHHHEGGYVREAGVHYLTLKGLVEATSETACAVAEVYADRIVVKGYGDQKNYVLNY